MPLSYDQASIAVAEQVSTQAEHFSRSGLFSTIKQFSIVNLICGFFSYKMVILLQLVCSLELH